MTKRDELIQKVRDGNVAILNDGNINQLREVILWCFPNDKSGLAGTSWVYRASTFNYRHWAANNEENKPTVSIREFYENEVQEWWQKFGIKFDGEWYTHPKTNAHNKLGDILAELKDWKEPAPDKTSIPVTNIKNENEFVWGEEVEVSDDNEYWTKRFYVAKNPKSNEYIATTDYGRIYAWVSVRKLPIKIKLTHQMIADKFDIDVNNLEII